MVIAAHHGAARASAAVDIAPIDAHRPRPSHELPAVVAMVGAAPTRLRIGDALRGLASVDFCAALHELPEALRARGASLVIVEPWTADGSSLAAAIRDLKQECPAVAVAVYCVLSREAMREMVALARAGADHVILQGHDDIRLVVRTMIAESRTGRGTSEAYDALAAGLPSQVHPLLAHCLANARRPPTVTTLATALGVHRRTLVNRVRSAGLPAPASLISWCRLLLAARLLEDRHRTVEQVALELQFGSGTALRNMFRRYVGLRPDDIRTRGGMQCVLDAMQRRLVRDRVAR